MGHRNIVMVIAQIAAKGKCVESRELVYFFHINKQNIHINDTCINFFNPIWKMLLTLLVQVSAH
jgi:hypothetical protein